jgi:O-antigen ligase
MAKAALSKSGMKWDVKLFLTFFFMLLLCAYPNLWVCIPGLEPSDKLVRPFDFHFPTQWIATFLSFSFLFFYKISLSAEAKKWAILFLCYVLLCSLSFHVNKSLPEELLEKIGYFVIPIIIAILVLKEGFFSDSLQRWMIASLTVLWSFMLLVSFSSDRPVGMSGNQNWFSTSLLSVSPWAFCAFYRCFKKFGRNSLFSFFSAFIAVVPVSLYWVYRCESRGAWLALCLYLLLLVLKQFSFKTSLKIASISTVLLFVVLFAFQTQFSRAYQKDIRGPLSYSSLQMALANSLLGVGPGNFEKGYPEFKSLEHSRRAVAALSTGHPHNEFLYLATELGIPVAAFWLLFCIYLLTGRLVTGRCHMAFFGFTILFVHGFLDKGLISPPGQLLFLLYAGLLLAGRWRSSVNTSGHSLKYIMVIFTLVVLLALPMTWRLSAVLEGRHLFLRAKSLEQALQRGKHSGTYRQASQQLYGLFDQAFTADPTNPKYSYMALHVAQENLADMDLVELQLARTLSLDKNHQHVNYFAGSYFASKWKKESDPILANNYKEQALSFYEQELRRNPYSFSSMNHILEFFVKSGLTVQANKLFMEQLRKIREYYQASAGIDDGSALLKSWSPQVSMGDPEALVTASKLLAGFNGMGFFDLHLPQLALAGAFLEKHNHSIFHKSDLSYWQDMIFITKEFPGGMTTAKMIEPFFVKVKVVGKQGFEFPGKVLRNGQGSSLAVACALRTVVHLHGKMSFLVRVETRTGLEWLVCVVEENFSFLVNVKLGKSYKVDIIKSLSSLTTFTEVIGEPALSVGIRLFEYPQAFSQRNVFLSKVLSSNVEQIKDFCSPPSLVGMNIFEYLNGQFEVKYLREPFVKFQNNTEN